MTKINFGCGRDYREDWLNIDITEGEGEKWKGVKKPDMIIRPEQTSFPSIKSSSVDYILVDNVFEHIEQEQVGKLILEFYRMLKPKGILKIYVPHFKGILVKFLEHKKCYGINSFWYFDKYFKIKQKLYLLNRNRNAGFKSLLFINNLNFLFNFNNTWQQICEKFVWFGFEEVSYTMTKRSKNEFK